MAKKKPDPWMIYGANGYTGALAARQAKGRGEAPILAGRNLPAIEALGRELDLPTRGFDLDRPEEVARQLQGVSAVLHCAGPFSATAAPMLEGCIASGTHYLDITGELDVFLRIREADERLKQAKIVAIPGSGFDVVPSDCMAALLKEALPAATHLRLAFKISHGIASPGSAKTMVETLYKGARIRRDGAVVTVDPGTLVGQFPFNDHKDESAMALAWGDVATAYQSTGIPNIECYMGMPESQIKAMKMGPVVRKVMGLPKVQGFLKKQIGKHVKGPTEAQRTGAKVFLVGEARAGFKLKRMRVTCPEGYDFTATTGIESTIRVVRGDVKPGAHTPSTAFGADYIKSFDGVTVETLA
jgi:short subunit dehydrogenase-like uncharacterized protein